MKPDMRSAMAYIEGRFYKVEDYPWDKVDERGPYALNKGVVYRYITDITKGLYPFRGEVDESFSRDTSPVGIYYRHRSHGRYQIIIIRPRNPREKEEYQLGKEKNLAVAVLEGHYDPEQFTDSRLSASDIGKDIYLPPIKASNDFMAKLIKLAIRQKAAPMDPYGARMSALAVDQRRSVEANNIKNNTIRRHKESDAMSPSKALQDADAWQLDLVVGVKNNPNAMHRIQGIPDDGMLVIFPNSAPFDLQQLQIVDAEDMLAKAILETNEGIESGRPQMLDEMDEEIGPGDE